MTQPLIAAHRKLSRSTAVVMGMTFLSRLAGFWRDLIFAQIFGATAAFDAFVIAFKIPNLLRRLFGEGAFSQALVPLLVRERTQNGETALMEWAGGLGSALGLIALTLVVIAEIAAPLIVLILAPGFASNPAHHHLAAQLLRIMLPYLFFMTGIALVSGVLNAYHRFALTALTPLLFNLILILIALWWAPQQQPEQAVIQLAWGVLLSGLIQFLMLLGRCWITPVPITVIPAPVAVIPAQAGIHTDTSICASLKMDSRLRGNDNCKDRGNDEKCGNDKKRVWRWLPPPAVWQTIKPILLTLLGASSLQISLLIDNLFASFLPAGSISWLYYADRLLYFPLGLIGAALVIVVTPHLSQHHPQENKTHFAVTLDWALRCLCLIGIPATLGLALLAGPILATLMHHGAFTAHDVDMTRRSLLAFALGLPAFMAIKIFSAAFYARHDTQTPARLAGLGILLNIGLNAVLISPFAHAGLALATTLASWFQAMLLWLFLNRRYAFRIQAGWRQLAGGILLGSLLMSTLLGWEQGQAQEWLTEDLIQSGWRLSILIGGGMGAYWLGLRLIGIRWKKILWN
jgi:putative peptidoglycan lipid II flippase